MSRHAMANYPYERDTQRGPWVREKLMGKGAFGSVILWKNEQTGVQLCVKECNHLELSERQRNSWKKECTIMLRLKHPNVARGLPTPPELESGVPDMPVLALEYCKGGDLRKLLNIPENCCGLKESEVRAIARDVSLAIEYLHGKQIAHRDLKPENIVMKHISGNKIQYKLIDLGYAKDVSAGSICKSFVGTEQYLAPELFTSASYPGQHYSSNVDYWCLGTTVFECIVGFRPFFHGIPAVQWLRHVCEKRPEQICGILNIDGDVVFSETIPTPNLLCKHSQLLFEKWLRLMLVYEPDQRGGGYTVDQRPVCFDILEKILKGQIINIYNVSTCRVLSYDVEGDTSVGDVMQRIQQDTRLPVQEQEILQDSGIILPEERLAVHCWEQQDEDNLFFLFPQASIKFTYQKRPQPELVQFLVSHSRGINIPYDILKRAYSHCVAYIIELIRDHNKLLLAQRAINVYLMRKKSDLSKTKKRMFSSLNELQSKIHFFKESIQLDFERLEKQKNTGIYSQKMVKFWQKTLELVSGYSKLEQDCNDVEKLSESLEFEVAELNKLPQGKPRNDGFGKKWKELVISLYDKFRKMPKEDRNSTTHDNSDMIHCVGDFSIEHTKQMLGLYSQIQKILECKSKIFEILPRICDLQNKLHPAIDKILTFQKQRQKDIWGLFGEVVKSVSHTEQSGLVNSMNNSVEPGVPSAAMPPPSSIPPQHPFLAPNPPAPITPSSTSEISNTSMLVERSAEESMNLMSESLSSLQRLQETVSHIRQTITTNRPVPDWSFLNTEDDDEDVMMED